MERTSEDRCFKSGAVRKAIYLPYMTEDQIKKFSLRNYGNVIDKEMEHDDFENGKIGKSAFTSDEED